MKNKKAYTMVELLAVIVIIGVILGIAVVGVNAFIDKARLSFYQNIEEELILAGSDFYNNNRNEKPIEGMNNVDIKDLQNKGYIDKIVDKDGNDSCVGNVYILAQKSEYDYHACISCEDGKYVTDDPICNGNHDNSKPSCVIILDKNWVFKDKMVTGTIQCNSVNSKLIDTVILKDNLKTQNSKIKINSLKKLSDDSNNQKVKYSFEVVGVDSGKSTITLLSGVVKNEYNKVNDKFESDSITVYNEADAGKIVKNLVYNGNNQTLITGGVGVTYNQTTGKNAGNYSIVATVKDGYLFSDGSKTNTLSTSIAKKIPIIKLNTLTGSVNKGSEVSFTETSDTKGTFTNKNNNNNLITIISGKSNNVKANGNAKVKIKGIDTGSTTITVSFKPEDINNYEIPSNLTYKVSVKSNSSSNTGTSGGTSNSCTVSCQTISGYCAVWAYTDPKTNVKKSGTSNCGETSSNASNYCQTMATGASDQKCTVSSMNIKKCLYENFRYSYTLNGNTKYSGYAYSSPSAAYNTCKSSGKSSCSSYCNTSYSTYTYHQ